MSDKNTNKQPPALQVVDGKMAGRYRERCEWALKRAFGDDKSLHIDYVQFFSVYKFSLSLTILNRRLERRVGAVQGSGEKDVLGKDIWTIAKVGENGDFAVAIPGTTTEETCHRCKGKKTCSHCGGTGKSDCKECNGSGTCQDCDGSGLQECPNCDGCGEVTKTETVICPKCDGAGGWRDYRGIWQECEACKGDRRWRESHSETCPTCGGDGKITCKTCGGRKTCGACDGSGKTKCKKCSGSGTCQECDATGKAKYSLWCVQQEISSSEKRWMEDKAKEISTAHTWNNEDCSDGHEEDMSTVCDIDVEGGEFQSKLLDEKYPGSYLTSKGSNEETETSVAKTFHGLWNSLGPRLLSKTDHRPSEKDDFKVVRQRYKIERIPVVAKYEFSMFGKKGFLLQDLTMSCSWDGDLSSIEREYWRRDARRTWVKCDLWFAATLAIGAAIAATPFVIGAKGISTCFETVVSPALVMGIGAFISIRFLSWYFYSYVWDLVERESRTRAYAEFDVSVKSVDHKIWVSGRDDNARRVLRLLWVLVPLVLVQGLCAKVPQVAQFLQPAKEWFAAISSTEWSYIAGVCALKAAIIWASRKWEWKFAVEKSVIVLLAVLALVFAIWPAHLPDGMALKGVMEQALPYVALPVRFLGLAVYWPIWIALWALGFVGRMAVSLVLWLISLFV